MLQVMKNIEVTIKGGLVFNVVNSIHEELLSLKETASEGSPKPEQECKRSRKEMHGKIRAFFAMHFVKVYIMRMVENLKRKFKMSKVESRKSIK